MHVVKDGRTWRVGVADDVAWLQDRPAGRSVVAALPLLFEAYATLYLPEDTAPPEVHEQAVVDLLAAHTRPQPWWLGYLDTGAHDVVFPEAPPVSLYFDWSYVLVEGGPLQAMTWRVGHMRSGSGRLPDLLFPVDRSWCLTALWDDGFTCLGGSEAVVDRLAREPLAGLHRVDVDQDMTPPGAPRD